MTETTATPKQDAPTRHAGLRAWVEEVAALTQPSAIHWCDGSAEEYDAICRQLGHALAATAEGARTTLQGEFELNLVQRYLGPYRTPRG